MCLIVKWWQTPLIAAGNCSKPGNQVILQQYNLWGKACMDQKMYVKHQRTSSTSNFYYILIDQLGNGSVSILIKAQSARSYRKVTFSKSGTVTEKPTLRTYPALHTYH